MTASTETLADTLADHAPALGALTVTEAHDVADQLRAIATALRGTSMLDIRVAGRLTKAASLVERVAGRT